MVDQSFLQYIPTLLTQICAKYNLTLHNYPSCILLILSVVNVVILSFFIFHFKFQLHGS